MKPLFKHFYWFNRWSGERDQKPRFHQIQNTLGHIFLFGYKNVLLFPNIIFRVNSKIEEGELLSFWLWLLWGVLFPTLFTPKFSGQSLSGRSMRTVLVNLISKWDYTWNILQNTRMRQSTTVLLSGLGILTPDLDKTDNCMGSLSTIIPFSKKIWEN